MAFGFCNSIDLLLLRWLGAGVEAAELTPLKQLVVAPAVSALVCSSPSCKCSKIIGLYGCIEGRFSIDTVRLMAVWLSEYQDALIVVV